MKGLWKYLAPFASDQSGATAVLYGLGGLVVICDAGGCAGNICSFDEPRWFTGGPSAVFSAGLREIDAILGRDDSLVAKVQAAAQAVEADFAALIGTPVPAVIGTDFRGLERLAEKRLGMPVVTVDTTGMVRYDVGIAKAYKSLLKKFVRKDVTIKQGMVNVLGAVPLDLPRAGNLDAIVPTLQQEGWQQICLFHCLEDYRLAGEAERNIALSPAGLTAAKWLQAQFGTPYECHYMDVTPLAERIAAETGPEDHILIVHQSVAARTLRKALEERGRQQVTTATWFQPFPGDVPLKEEEDFIRLVRSQAFRVVAADKNLWQAIGGFTGTLVDFPHYAVSGRR